MIRQLGTRRLGEHTGWAYREVLSPYSWAQKLCHIKMLPLPAHTLTRGKIKETPCVCDWFDRDVICTRHTEVLPNTETARVTNVG